MSKWLKTANYYTFLLGSSIGSERIKLLYFIETETSVLFIYLFFKNFLQQRAVTSCTYQDLEFQKGLLS